MSRKARIWTGITLLLVIAINYAIITLPLVKRSNTIDKRARAIFISKSSDDEYVLELFRKEKRDVERKIAVVNAVALTCTVIVISWTVFGIIFHKRR